MRDELVQEAGFPELITPHSLLLTLFAAADFPRGPGLYLNLFSLTLVLIAYFGWVRTCWWVDQDARRLGLETNQWNTLIFGGGLVGLGAFWLLPWFFIAYLLLLVCILAPTSYYVWTRNQQVPTGRRVWTRRHLKLLGRRYLNLPLTIEAEVEPRPRIKLVPRTLEAGEEEAARLRRCREAPGVPEVLSLLADAVQHRATDIQLEPNREVLAVRYRIDGVAHDDHPLTRLTGEAVIQALKLVAQLEATERRKPQEGQLAAEVDGRRVDFRVQASGSIAGERASIRLIDRAQPVWELGQLGMPDNVVQAVSRVVRQPRGLFLIAGPADSGKTAAVYACLQLIERGQRKVFTLEDAIDQRLPKVNQQRLDLRQGTTVAAELRSVLRQEAQVVFVGELRDREPAELACEAAKERALVFSIVPAADALAGLFRLLDLGVPAAKVADALLGVLAPRLVRRLCPACKLRYRPKEEMVRKANLPADRIKFFHRPPEKEELKRNHEGQILVCGHCEGLGYFGRDAVFELLVVNDRIRELLREGPALHAVKQEAVKNGLSYLQDEAMQLVMNGTTSIAEVLRVLK